ncbi:hypothetical protein [Mesorhizobium sp.]|uniref:hypothetical protein n=1 Tax=Mesorhizobium sp. TaxID=1871066 RepID=UPI0025D3F78F|nr:hypothetical protein [Mesorhizobium sp.]
MDRSASPTDRFQNGRKRPGLDDMVGTDLLRMLREDNMHLRRVDRRGGQKVELRHTSRLPKRQSSRRQLPRQKQPRLDLDIESRQFSLKSVLQKRGDLVRRRVRRQRDRLEFGRICFAQADAVIRQADDPVAGGRLLLRRDKPRPDPSQLIEPPVPKIQTLLAECRHDPPTTAPVDSRPKFSH